MGMKISIALEHLKHSLIDCEYPLTTDDKQAIYDTLVDVVYKYQLMQPGYKRLKADFITILTELHLKMEELGDDLDPTEDWDYGYKSGVEDMIQLLDERIDKLKGESDAQEQKKE